MDKIDWFKANERSLRKYENFTSALASLGVALEDTEKVVKQYLNAAPSGAAARNILHVEPEELKAALADLYESLNSLVAKARKHEAKLKSWEWQL
ncbi:hypothetical protein GCM10027447_34760 [Glycomyces halotolerans]